MKNATTQNTGATPASTSVFNKIVAVITALSLVFLQTPISGLSGQAMADATDAAQAQLAANTATDVPLTFENAYITYAGQVIAPPATMVTIPGGAAMEFTAAADAGYQLESVRATINGTEVELAADGNGVYALTAADVATTTNIYVRAITAPTVEAAVVAEEPAAEGADAPDAGTSTTGPSAQSSTSAEYTYEDADVKVTATLSQADAVPANAVFQVKPVTATSQAYDYDAYMDALNEAAAEGVEYTAENTLLYDISFMVPKTDEAGGEIAGEYVEYEPQVGTVSITITFKQAQLAAALDADEAADVEVIHLPLRESVRDGVDSTADATDLRASDIIVESAQQVSASVEDEQASFTLSSLSVAAVSTAAASGSLASGSLAASAISTAAATVQAASATPTSTNLADFLTGATFNAPQNENGEYVVTDGGAYTFTLAFAENQSLQFPNDGSTMSYALPAGLNAADGQQGTLNIKVNDGGVFSTVSGNRYWIEGGVLYFQFNTSDPNFSKLTAASNAKVNMTFTGTVDSSATNLHFKDGISKDIEIDTSNSVSATKSAWIGDDNKVHYTVSVVSKGTSKNVVVKDTITGDVLSLDAGSISATSSKGGSVDMSGGATGNSFTYTIGQMTDGEVVQFSYTASIDSAKIVKGADGKYTAKGNNEVRVKSDGDPTEDVINKQVTIDYTPGVYKSSGMMVSSSGTTKTMLWTVTVNDNPKVSVAGSTVNDAIDSGSQSIMKYSGDGISVAVYDASGNVVRTDRVGWGQMTKSDTAWSYTIPSSDKGKAYKYVITYTTDVDSSGLSGNTQVKNSAGIDGGNTSWAEGTVPVSGNNTNPSNPDNPNGDPQIQLTKSVEKVDVANREITWKVSFNVPEEGLTSAVVTDTYPNKWVDALKKRVYEPVKEGSVSVEGLASGETWDISYGDESAVITFYQNQAKTTQGLKSGDARVVTVTLKTVIDEDILENSKVAGQEWLSTHENNASIATNVGTASGSAQAQVNDGSLSKSVSTIGYRDVDGVQLPIYRYELMLSNVTSNVNVIEDTFDTSVLEVIEHPTGDRDWESLYIFGGNVYYQGEKASNRFSYVYTADGIRITTSPDTMPQNAQAGDGMYSCYKLVYYLTVKDKNAYDELMRRAAESDGGAYQLTNTAEWEGKTDSADVEYTYAGLTKEILTPDSELSKTDEDIWADFRITLNPNGAMLNGGEPMTMTDTYENLSIDFHSIKATPSAGVSWDASGNVVTYQIPDQTKVVITYRARVVFDNNGAVGETKHVQFSNVAEMNGFVGEVNKSGHRTNNGSGSATINAINLLKYEGGDMTKRLAGATFALLDADKNPVKDKWGNAVTFTTPADGHIEIRGDQDELGWTIQENQRYYLRETVAPQGFAKAGFDYSFQISEDGTTDYSQYIYHNGDTLTVKNWPGESEPETVNVPVRKVWDDANNQDGKRLTQVYAELVVNGERSGTKVKLSADNDWSASFAGLPKYDDNGNEIDYSVRESTTVSTAGYTKSVSGNMEDGFVITNAHTPATTTVSGTKTWSDAGNADGNRPAAVTVHLYADGEDTGKTATATEANGWAYSFADLPVYKAGAFGQAITYTVVEDAVADYTATYNGTGVVNTYAPDTTQLTVTKSWNDNHDQDGARPKSITVQLFANGEAYDTQALTAANGWAYTWGSLPARLNGEAATYTVNEVAVDGYTSAIEATEGGYVITNTHTPETTNVSATKVWDDNGNQDGLRGTAVNVVLYANGEQVRTATLSGDNGWSVSWDGLPKNAGGKAIEYTLAETASSVPKGYNTPIIARTDAADGIAFTVTNTHAPETTSVSGEKTWSDANDQDGKRPASIVVNLLANDVKTASATVAPDADGTWAYEFTDLPVYANGEAIKYSVAEEPVEGYAASYSGFDIVNVRVPETTSVSVAKAWDDDDDHDGLRPGSISVQLSATANGQPVSLGDVATTATLNAGNKWRATWADLPKYANGAEIAYTVTEGAVADYSADSTRMVTAAGTAVALKNTHVPEYVDVSVDKEFSDANNQDGSRPESVDVQLVAKVNGQAVTLDGVTTSATLSDANGWHAAWSSLPKMLNGAAVAYSIAEANVNGYEPSLTSAATAATDEANAAIAFTLTNTHTPETTSVSGTKTWNDNNNQDGIRPASITVNLLANGNQVATQTVSATEGDTWAYTFTDLPKYAGGQPIEYTVSEPEVSGYTSVASGMSLVNTHTPETIDIPVTKTWDDNGDQDGARPTSITVNLLADGVLAQKATFGAPEGDEGDTWTYTFTNLPKYRNGGTPILYTLQEEMVVVDEEHATGYSTDPIAGNAEEGFSIVNRHTPETTSVSGEKTWDDASNQDAKRPTSITVNLLANGNQVATQTVAAEGDTWAYSFDDLPKYANGTEIAYTVTEDAVAGYSTVIDGTSIVNSYTPGKVSVNGSKVWDDNNDQDGIRPDSVTVHLLANGNDTGKSAVVDASTKWTYTFTDLDEYAAGEKIAYTVTEDAVTGYEKTIDGFTITNAHTPETTSLEGVKTWDDDNDQDGIRPAFITVNLLADNKVVRSVTVTADDDWKYSFTGLPKYDSGAEISYTVAEATIAYDTAKVTSGYVSTVTGNNIANAHTPETVDIPVSKEWVDADDQDGLRPSSVTVNLLAGGEVVRTAEIAPEANGDWAYTFTDLPKYAGGQLIAYSVAEEAVAGYETAIDGYSITNTHTPDVTDVSVSKAWSDYDDRDGIRPESVTVHLHATTEDGVVALGTVATTVTLDSSNGWSHTWKGLPVNAAGKAITYTVTEDAVEGYTASVASAQDGTAFTVTNAHYSARGTAELYAKKALAGRALAAGEFSFELLDDQGNVLQTVANAADGTARFDAIEYTQADLGDHAYTIREVAGDAAGVTYDLDERTVVVTVSDADHNGTLDISYSGFDPATGVVFSNTYSAAGSVTFAGTKSLEGRAMTAADVFTFTISENGTGKTWTAQNDATGEIAYPAISYTLADVGTHTYTVAETSADGNGVTVDERAYAVTVVVADNGDGTLNVEASDNSQALDFTNTYRGSATAQLKAFKTLNGDVPEAGAYSFTLAGHNVGENGTETVANDGNGEVVFSDIAFDQSDIGHTYMYTMTEVAGDDEGTTYDASQKRAWVEVGVGEGGELVATVTYDGNGMPPTFENASVTKLSLGGAKTIENRAFNGAESITFTIAGSDGAPLPASTSTTVTPAANTTVADFSFGDIAFTNDHVGHTYIYTVSESANLAGVTNDAGRHTVSVEVTRDKGVIVATPTYSDGSAISFTNTYSATGTLPFAGAKSIDGRALTADDVFAFEVAEVGTDKVWAVSNDATGAIAYPTIGYTLADVGEHSYTVRETSQGGAGIAVDDRTYTVTVNVADNGDGTLAVTPAEGSDDYAALDFENGYQANGEAQFAGTKSIDTRDLLEGETYSFSIVEDSWTTVDGATVAGTYSETATSDDTGKIAYPTISYGAGDVGTHAYTVKESTEDGRGVVTSASSYAVKVTVTDNGDGTLKVEASDNATELNFQNAYTATGSITFEGTKTLVGRDMKAGEFTFAILEGDKVVAEGKNSAAAAGEEGAIAFDAIEYGIGDVGTHHYAVVETTPEGNGITPDATVFDAEVVVTDNGDGTLTATKSSDDSAIAFVNSYTTSADVTLTAHKTVNGEPIDPADAGAYTFRVTGPKIDGYLEASNDARGDVPFGPIAFETADAGKSFEYQIYEVAGTNPGMTYDTAPRTATVHVASDSEGRLSTEVVYAGGERPVIDNAYEATGEVAFEGAKSIDGRALTANDVFTFEIVEAGTGKTLTAMNDSTGAINYPVIEYALDDVGTHTYQVRETSTDGKGITVATNSYTVVVNVADNGDGTLNIEAAEGSDDYTALNFENGYQATGEVTFRGAKSIDTRSLAAGDVFTFEVAEDGTGNVWTVRNDETGKIAYPTIQYTLDDLGTHTYTVSETSTDGNGVTVATDSHTVEVTVSDNGDGTLKVEASDNAEALSFQNAYAATGEVTFAGTKSIDGRNLTADDVFTFEVAEDGTDNVWTAQNDETGKIAFPTISYTLADEGTHTYQVRETSTGGNGITVDGRTYTVTVNVSDNGDGTLKVEASDNAEALNFTNTYTAEGSLPLSAAKTFNGEPAEGYTFVLSGGNLAEPRTATSVVGSPDSADGVASFGSVSYTLADDGKDYTYTIREVIPEGAERQGETDTYKLGGYLYDGHVATITVHVADNGAGAMVPTVTATEGSTTFGNSYEASGSIAFAATKTVTGAAIEEGAFEFELVGADDGVAQTKSNDANGAVAFDAITYDAAGTYRYTISEKAGEAAGYTYDAAVYDATVVVTDNGDGTMTATPTYTKTVGEETSAVQAISFANAYEANGAVTFAGTKSIDTRALTADDVFTFEIAEVGTDNVWTAQNDETGKINYPTISYTLADAGEHTYQVRETSTSGDGITVDGNVRTVTVKVSDNGDGTLAVEPSEGFDALDFTNAYDANGSVTFQGEKTMAGRELTAGDVFTFTIAQVDEQGNVLATLADKAVATGETGAIAYPKITYSMSDMLNEDGTYAVSKTFRYTVTEDVPADATATDDAGNAVAYADATDEQKAAGGFAKDGVTYSSDVKTFEVEVTDDGKGTLNAVAAVSTDAGMTALAEAAAADEAARTPSVSSTGLSKVATNLDGDFNSTVRVKLLGEEASEPEPQPEAEKPTFDIVFVVDASQSQGDTATALMNQMFAEAENGGYKVNIGVVKYYYVAQVTRYLDGSAGWNEASSKAGTNLPAGIMLGTQLLDDDKSVPADNKYLVVLSDGDTYIYQKGNQLNSYMKGNVLRTNGDDAMVVTQRDSDYNNGTPFAGPGSYSWKYHNGASEPADFAPPADWDAYFATVGPQVIADAGAYETAWGWQKNNIYSYVTNAIPEDEIFDHACSVDTSLYYSLVNYRAASEKYHTYAAFVYGGYNRPYGESFMTYLNGGATLDLSSLGDTIASDIENSTAVQVAKGGVIKDTIGYGYDNEGNAYDMDFVNELATTDIVFNGTVLSKAVAEDGSFTFGTASDGSPLFTLAYTGKAEPGTEGYTVTFSDEVLATDTVEMRYRVHLSDPQTKTGTYGTYAGSGDPEGTVGLLVSSQATFEREGTTAAFANPVVSYSALGFDNSYDATGSLTLEGVKSMEGRALTADDVFAFEVTEDDETVATGENDATGKIAFTPIAFTLDDVGTHTYTVKETSESANGVTTDSRTRTVTVEVSDNGDGTLAVEVAEDSEPIEFVNAYSASGAGEVRVQKMLTGRNWTTDDAFEFTIAPVGDAPAFANSTVTVTEGSADYTESFGEVAFTTAGTYQWTVSETHKGETIDGVTYDAADKTVTIVVRDDGNGNLVAEEGSDLVQTAAFTNTFSSGTEEYDASASVEFVALKSLEGRTLGPAEFSFSLSEVDSETGALTHVGDAVNNGAGEVRFGAIRYTLADLGEHTYVVSENAGDLIGVDYDGNEYEFTVTVTDNGDGTLGVAYGDEEQVAEDGAYSIRTDVTFTNTYTPSGSVVLEATKLLEGGTLEAGAYTFQVADQQGTVYATATNAADGTVTFPALTFKAPGTYVYQISEVVPEGAQTLGPNTVANGVAYDTHSVKATIVAIDNFNGTLRFDVTYEGDGATFTNATVPDTEYPLTATKLMQGRAFTAGDAFTFTVTADDERAPMPERSAVTVVAAGGNEAAIDFGDITFTTDDLGRTYTYTIAEEGAGETVGGLQYDPFAHWVKLTVNDAGDGTMRVDAQYQNDGDGIVFTNTYSASAQAVLTATKVLEGRDLAEGEFFFELTGADDAAKATLPGGVDVLHASNAADGTIAFQPITFSADDAGKDFTYTISETRGTLKGITYDESAYDVTVHVADNGDGTMSVSYDWGEAGAPPTFTNRAIVRTGFEFDKYHFGGEGTFSFTLTAADADGSPRAGTAVDYSNEELITDDGTSAFVATVQNGAYENGVAKVVFPEIGYAADGDYYYLVAENASSTEGMIADEAQYLVHVSVADGVAAEPVYELIYDGVTYGVTTDLSFYNNSAVTLGFNSLSAQSYTDMGQRVSVYPEAQKYLNGSTDQLVGGDFAFELVDQATGQVIAVATNDEAGKVAFFDEDTDPGLAYDEPGEYSYLMREVAGDEAGMTYDDSVILMTVSVTQTADGLAADVTYNGPGGAEPAFYNVKEGMDIAVYKVSRFGGEGLDDCTYALWMAGAAGDVMIQEATSDETGLIVFRDVALMAGQKYYFKEVAAPKGHTVDPYRTAYFSLNEAGDALVLVEDTASDGWHSANENIELDKAKGEEN